MEPGDRMTSPAVGWPDRAWARIDDRLSRLGVVGEFPRDVALAVLVLVGSTALLAVLLVAPTPSGVSAFNPAQAGLALAGTAVQALLLSLRRWRPALCLGLVAVAQTAMTVALPVSVTVRGFAPLVAAYTCGARLPVRRVSALVVGVVVLETAGVAVAGLLVDPGGPGGAGPLLTLVLGALLAGVLTDAASAVLGAYVATRRRYADLQRLRAEDEVDAQRARADAAIGEERARMARELHDVAAHDLSGMVVQAAVVERLVDHDPQAAKEAAAWVRRQGKETLESLRQVVGTLRGAGDPDDGAPVPGLGVLEHLVDATCALGTPVSLTRDGEVPALPPLADVTFYRVAQEALANARDHAPGAPVRMTLGHREGQVVLEVHNDAGTPLGARPADRRGFGLIGLRERAQIVGAQLEAGPTPCGGWRVAIMMALEPASAWPNGAP